MTNSIANNWAYSVRFHLKALLGERKEQRFSLFLFCFCCTPKDFKIKKIIFNIPNSIIIYLPSLLLQVISSQVPNPHEIRVSFLPSSTLSFDQLTVTHHNFLYNLILYFDTGRFTHILCCFIFIYSSVRWILKWKLEKVKKRK